MIEDAQADLDDFAAQVMFLAMADPDCRGRHVRQCVMRKRIDHELMKGETDLNRLVRVALGDEVLVMFPGFRKI